MKNSKARNIRPFEDPFSGGFSKGFCLLRLKDAKAVRNEIMSALELQPGNKATWKELLKGVRPIYSKDAVLITNIFLQYGINKKDIWGEDSAIDDVNITWS